MLRYTEANIYYADDTKQSERELTHWICLHRDIDWPTKVIGNNEQDNAEMFKPKKNVHKKLVTVSTWFLCHQ